MRSAVILALALATASCATTGTGSEGAPTGDITQGEIRGSGLIFVSAYDVVRQFRPQWLLTRGISILQPQSPSDATLLDYVGVYEDELFLGGPDNLRTIPAQNIRRIEHFDRARAQRLGSRSHIHGAIVVHTRSR